MADPLSIAAGIIAVITATIQSSTALYDTIESFNNYPRRVQELLTQLQGLIKILSSLRELSKQDERLGDHLEIPLRECGETCLRFRQVLELHRGSLTTGNTFSAWISFRFRNGDIVNFMETLAVYKSTMEIAIADANLRTSTVTLRVLNEYKKGVDATTEHVQQHFEEVLSRLDALRTPTNSDQQGAAPSSDYLDQVYEEKNSVEHCLQICRRFQADFEQAQFELAQGLQPAGTENRPANATQAIEMTLASMTTLSSVKACGLEMSHAVNKLNNQAATAQNRLIDVSSPSLYGQNQVQYGGYVGAEDQEQADNRATESEGIEHELASMRQLLDFCKDASSRATPERVHIVEDIAVGDNSRQVCVSNVGDLFKIRKATAGDNSFQFFGSIGSGHLHEITRLHPQGQNRRDAEEDEDRSDSQEDVFEQVYAGSASRAS